MKIEFNIICESCGARLSENICEYCGTVYEFDYARKSFNESSINYEESDSTSGSIYF